LLGFLKNFLKKWSSWARVLGLFIFWKIPSSACWGVERYTEVQVS